jgi:hypothetical protein
MSHSSLSYFPAADQPARQASPRAQSAAAISRHLQRTHNGYTLTHAGHQIRIGPVAFWIVVGGLVAMAIWSIATGTYFAFRDNVLTRLIGRQAEMQFAYEDRIAELRAQVDRIMSRQLLDQEQFEKTLNSLLQRQSTLEQRASHWLAIHQRRARSNRRARRRPCPRLKSPYAYRQSVTQ